MELISETPDFKKIQILTANTESKTPKTNKLKRTQSNSNPKKR